MILMFYGHIFWQHWYFSIGQKSNFKRKNPSINVEVYIPSWWSNDEQNIVQFVGISVKNHTISNRSRRKAKWKGQAKGTHDMCMLVVSCISNITWKSSISWGMAFAWRRKDGKLRPQALNLRLTPFVASLPPIYIVLGFSGIEPCRCRYIISSSFYKEDSGGISFACKVTSILAIS